MSGCGSFLSPLPRDELTPALSARFVIYRKRLLSLAAQKFVSDIAADAYQHARIRTNAAGGRARSNQVLGPGTSRVRLYSSQSTSPAHRMLCPPQDKTRTTLTMEDLSAALSDYGINARKPEFYL